MTTVSSFSFATIVDIAARLVGLTFIWTGAIKAIAPRTFRQHLARLGFIPQSLLIPAVVSTAAFEAGWGAALIVRLAPSVVLPVTALLLTGFSFISWWGVHSGKTTDCGCYGGYIQPSIAQSLALNALFAAACLGAWLLVPVANEAQAWKIGIAVCATLAAGVIAALDQSFESRTGSPRFMKNPLVIGARFRKSWARGRVSDSEGEVFVSYLGPDCPFCMQWVRFLNAIDGSPTMPRVVGVFGTSQDKLEEFISSGGVRFETVNISQSLMNRLANAVPVTVRVVSGSVADIWVGAMPPALYARFREAFFPGALSATQS